MNLQGVSHVVPLERPAETTAEEAEAAAVAVESKEKCILQYVQNVELLLKFRLCLKMTDPFIAASAFKHVGKFGTFVVA